MRKLLATTIVGAVSIIGAATAWAVTGTSGTSAVDGPELRVSTLRGAPGDTITIEGGGCGTVPGTGAWSAEVWLTPAPGTVPWDPAFGDPVATIAPDDHGSWSAQVTVPEWRTDYRLEAACFDQATPPGGFLYSHLRFVAD